jgi:hypothetical protein
MSAACAAAAGEEATGSVEADAAATGATILAHVALRLPNGAVVADTRDSGRPLALRVPSPSDAPSSSSSAAAPVAAASASTLPVASSPAAAAQAADIAARKPARSLADVFGPDLAAAASGAFVSERRTLRVHNPAAGGFYDPDLCWLQPRQDYVDKFGRQPAAGAVFWYEPRPGAWLQTLVSSAGPLFVELDANYGLSDCQLVLEMEVVAA